MKKLGIALIVAACVIGWGLLPPVISIDGELYGYNGITQGVENLTAERDLFYRELEEGTKKEISSFLAGQRPDIENADAPQPSANGLEIILQRKYDAAANQDRLFAVRFASLLEEHSLPPRRSVSAGKSGKDQCGIKRRSFWPPVPVNQHERVGIR